MLCASRSNRNDVDQATVHRFRNENIRWKGYSAFDPPGEWIFQTKHVYCFNIFRAPISETMIPIFLSLSKNQLLTHQGPRIDLGLSKSDETFTSCVVNFVVWPVSNAGFKRYTKFATSRVFLLMNKIRGPFPPNNKRTKFTIFPHGTRCRQVNQVDKTGAFHKRIAGVQ